jgi:hypothetical protein
MVRGLLVAGITAVGALGLLAATAGPGTGAFPRPPQSLSTSDAPHPERADFDSLFLTWHSLSDPEHGAGDISLGPNPPPPQSITVAAP